MQCLEQISEMRFICLKLILILNLHVISADSLLTNFGERINEIPRIHSENENLIPPGVNNRDDKSQISPADLIRRENYPVEIHKVTTEDGYMLTLFRIPGRFNSTPVYMQHGLLEDSGVWLVAGNGKSLAYILSDSGYDVWLGNARGSTYSKLHKTFSSSDPKFWDFSWQELGVYDNPAVINYIGNLTGNNLFYVGHSMASTTFSVMAIERPEVASKVKAMIGLAPATYVYHLKSPLRLLAPFRRQFQQLSNGIGIYELFPRSTFFDILASYICTSSLVRNIACSKPLFTLAGNSYKQLNSSILPTIWSQFPAGTSVKLFTHWLQQISVNQFRKFDYGKITNIKMYNSWEPPVYDLSKMHVPTALIWSENDWLVGPEDVQHFYNELPFKIGMYKVEDPKFNHFDFVWGADAPKLVYKKVLKLLNSHDNQIDKQ